MALCCADWEIENAIKEASHDAADQIAAIGQGPSVATAYNNFDYIVGRRKLSDEDDYSLRTVTKGLAYETNFIPEELTQSMLNPNFKLTDSMFDTSAFIDDDLDF